MCAVSVAVRAWAAGVAVVVVVEDFLAGTLDKMEGGFDEGDDVSFLEVREGALLEFGDVGGRWGRGWFGGVRGHA